jgi:hypothetical protein
MTSPTIDESSCMISAARSDRRPFFGIDNVPSDGPSGFQSATPADFDMAMDRANRKSFTESSY